MLKTSPTHPKATAGTTVALKELFSMMVRSRPCLHKDDSPIEGVVSLTIAVGRALQETLTISQKSCISFQN